MSRVDKAAKGILASFFQYGCQIGLQVLLAPLVLAFAGQEVLGAYALIMQAVAYLAMTDMGFSLSLTRFLSQAFGREDGRQYFEIVLTTSRTILLFTNLLFALLLVLLAIYSKDLFSFSQSIALQTNWGLSLLACWVVVRTPFLIYREGLNASQNMGSANVIEIAGIVIRLVFSLSLVALGFGLVGLVLANIIGEATTLFLCARRFHILFSEINPRWGLPDRVLLSKMFGFCKHALVINLAWRLVAGTDNIVVGFLYGAAATSVYYTTQMPTVIGYLLVNKLVDNVGPAINELFEKKEFDKLSDIFLRLHRYAWLLVSPLFAGILLLNKTMITAWVGPAQYAGDLMTFALASFALLNVAGHVNMVFIIATGELSQLSRLALFEGIVNLGLSFLLGYHLGLQGVMLATLIAHIPMAIFLQNRGMSAFNVQMGKFVKFVIFPVIVPCSIAAACTFIVLGSTPGSGWLSFGCAASVLLVVYTGLAYLLAIDRVEKLWLRKNIFRAFQIIRG